MPILPIALLLDAVVGYPEKLLRVIRHPVILMGHLVTLGDRHLNKPHYGIGARYLFGCFWLAIMAATAALAGIMLTSAFSGWWQLLEILLVSSLLATKSLRDHVAAVATGLRHDLKTGRTNVGKIVGRDTIRNGPCRGCESRA